MALERNWRVVNCGSTGVQMQANSHPTGQANSAPGFYKTSYSAISWRGLARVRGLLRLPLVYLITRFKQPDPGNWMPQMWADLECSKQDLSARFWEATVRHRQDFARLGFSELGLKKNRKSLNPVLRDNGGVNYLDKSRLHFGQLIYAKAYAAAPINAERESITFAFTAVFQCQNLSYTNSKGLFEVVPRYEVVRVPSGDVHSIYSKFKEHLARLAEPPRHFPDDDSLRSWFDANQREVFEHRVRTGLFIKMTDAEVEAARRKLPPPLPNR